ncbi:short-chain dehydrogenase/reductase family protein-like protein [Mycena sanguinolenta]|nr:short-chain dehydrogenase/reductase family protein-like protein [Mycena sanguinolenta]
MVDQWRTQAPVSKVDLTGKTVIVLGANTGLGFEATKHFVTMSPGRIILACRSQSKGDTALEKLKALTGYAKAGLWIIDLADFSSVKQFADKFERDGGRLDILVENAAVTSMQYAPFKDNRETSLQVNNLSTPLLALLLLPAMIRTAEQFSTTPRLVVVSS